MLFCFKLCFEHLKNSTQIELLLYNQVFFTICSSRATLLAELMLQSLLMPPTSVTPFTLTHLDTGEIHFGAF